MLVYASQTHYTIITNAKLITKNYNNKTKRTSKIPTSVVNGALELNFHLLYLNMFKRMVPLSLAIYVQRRSKS